MEFWQNLLRLLGRLDKVHYHLETSLGCENVLFRLVSWDGTMCHSKRVFQSDAYNDFLVWLEDEITFLETI